MSIVCGLDLASRSGIAYGRPDTIPHIEVVKAPVCGDDLGLFGSFWLNYFTSLLNGLCDRLQPGEDVIIAYEAPTLPRERWDPEKMKMVGMTQLATTRRLHSMGVLLETVCRIVAEARDVIIRVYECFISSIKKELAGSGKADKSMMVLAARRFGVTLPDGDEAFDGADALGCWVLAIRHQLPEFQSIIDRRLYGSSRP